MVRSSFSVLTSLVGITAMLAGCNVAVEEASRSESASTRQEPRWGLELRPRAHAARIVHRFEVPRGMAEICLSKELALVPCDNITGGNAFVEPGDLFQVVPEGQEDPGVFSLDGERQLMFQGGKLVWGAPGRCLRNLRATDQSELSERLFWCVDGRPDALVVATSQEPKSVFVKFNEGGGTSIGLAADGVLPDGAGTFAFVTVEVDALELKDRCQGSDPTVVECIGSGSQARIIRCSNRFAFSCFDRSGSRSAAPDQGVSPAVPSCLMGYAELPMTPSKTSIDEVESRLCTIGL
jgi:hypothetical protein